MSKQDIDPPTGKINTDCAMPRHPFFETVDEQANYTDCINAIDRVRAMIDLCASLKLEEVHSGLSPDAAYGFYWITVLMESALNYVSYRLVELNSEIDGRLKQESAHLSALFNSLPTLGRVNRVRFLNHTASQMDVSRSDIEQFIKMRSPT
jgi:hypothetical protein